MKVLNIKAVDDKTRQKFRMAASETGKTQGELLKELLTAYQEGEKVKPVIVELKDPDVAELLSKIEKELRTGMTQAKAFEYIRQLRHAAFRRDLSDGEKEEIQKLGKLLEDYTPTYSPEVKKQIERHPSLALKLWRTGTMEAIEADMVIESVRDQFRVMKIDLTKEDILAYLEHVKERHEEEERNGHTWERPYFKVKEDAES